MRGRTQDILTAVVLLGAVAGALLVGHATARHRPLSRSKASAKMLVDRAGRLDALRRAQVWRQPEVPVEMAELGRNPPGTFDEKTPLPCRFELSNSTGMTPKFNCITADGQRIKVKYGVTNAETVAELAATRLLRALGFGADNVYGVESVVCTGCPVYPYPRTPFLDAVRRDPGRVIAFRGTTVERPFGGRAIETAVIEGWGFDELVEIDEALGGAPRADVDALRLMAVFLANWDNKHENQRLVCLDGGPPSPVCTRPFALMQDVGVSFGPRRLDVAGWEGRPLWKDRARCLVSMKDLPFAGATFTDVQITEGGRQKAALLLGRLQRPQVLDLFVGAGIVEFAHPDPVSADPGRWVRAFDHRRAQLSGGPPCPLR